MNTSHEDRDQELAGLLAELPIPDHGDTFWSELESGFTNGAGGAPVAKVTPIPTRSSRRTFVAAGLAAAAVIMIGFFAVGALSSDGTNLDTDLTTDAADAPDVTEAPTTTVRTDTQPGLDEVLDYRSLGDPERVSDGEAIAFTPDGSAVLVLGEHPDGGTGSEGARLQTVWAQPLDGSARRLALSRDVTIETGTYAGAFVIGPNDHMAWSEWCDGFLCGLRSARLGPDGDMVDVVDVDLSGQEAEAEPRIDDLTVTDDGVLYFSLNGRLARALPGEAALAIFADEAAEAVTVVPPSWGNDVVAAVAAGGRIEFLGAGPEPLTGLPDNIVEMQSTPAGQLVVASADGRVLIVDPSSGERVDVVLEDVVEATMVGDGGLSVSPDGGTIAVSRFQSLLLVGDDGLPVMNLAPDTDRPRLARFSPDGLAVVYSATSPDGATSEIWIRRLEAPAQRDLQQQGELVAVASFTTEFECCQNRVENIERIAELTEGAVIGAGEVFSLNDHVGERTEEKGFVADGALVDGVLMPVVGGGVSQYATTLFNAAFFAGLDVVEHQSYPVYISRYPRGRDATISWPGPDLVIGNTNEHDVVISNEITDTSITVTLYSMPTVEVDVGAVVEYAEGRCLVLVTPRLRTYPDGTTVEDSVEARYQPGIDQPC